MKMNITVGMKLTILSVSEWLANTQKHEVQVHGVTDEPVLRPHYQGATFGKWRVGTVSQRGKRKAYFLDIKPESLVFEGWDLPIKTDHEQSLAGENSSDTLFQADAMLNLAGDYIKLKELIDTKNLNPWFTEDMKKKIVHVDRHGVRSFLYGDPAKPVGHS